MTENKAIVADSSHHIEFKTPSVKSLVIHLDDGDPVLTIERGEGGKWVAKYDPENLDAAAQVFVETVNFYLAGGKPHIVDW